MVEDVDVREKKKKRDRKVSCDATLRIQIQDTDARFSSNEGYCGSDRHGKWDA